MATKVKYGKVELSEYDMQYIRDHFTTKTNSQIAKELGLKITIMRTWAYSQGLYKLRLEYWTQEQIVLLQNNYKQLGDTEIAEMFTGLFPKQKGWSKKHIEKKRRYLGLKRTEEERNKIFLRNKQNGAWDMCAKKRWETVGVRPDGDIVVWQVAGRPIIHKKNQGKYVPAHRLLWEQVNGPIPNGMVITFKNMDTTDLRIENLAMVSKKEAVGNNFKSDRYVAALVGKRANRDEILKHPEIIELKRKQLQLNRAINTNKNDTGRN